jgi:hypothetical protein
MIDGDYENYRHVEEGIERDSTAAHILEHF